jgi:predicted ATPase
VRSAFVGRDAEIAAVGGELDEALAGRARVVLCRGEPGIGKTRLAEELSDLARERGAEVAWGVGIEAAGAPPYWPWTQVLRAVSGWCDLGAVAAEHDLAVDLARLAPDVFDAAGQARPSGSAEDRFGQFDAVARLLCLVCRRRPLVLVLDDAHWADRPSVLLIRHVARSLSGERLLLVVSLRSTENAHVTDFAELAREPVTRQIELTGITAPAVARQLASITGQPVDGVEARKVHALTGGNPFFVAEVGRVLPVSRIGGAVAPVTPNVRAAIAARSTGCPLRASSCCGRRRSPVATSPPRWWPTCSTGLCPTAWEHSTRHRTPA